MHIHVHAPVNGTGNIAASYLRWQHVSVGSDKALYSTPPCTWEWTPNTPNLWDACFSLASRNQPTNKQTNNILFTQLSRLSQTLVVLNWTALHCTVLYYTVMYCTAIYCTAMYCTVLYCNILYWTVLHCTALHYTVLQYTVLQCTVLQCNVVYSELNWTELN